MIVLFLWKNAVSSCISMTCVSLQQSYCTCKNSILLFYPCKCNVFAFFAINLFYNYIYCINTGNRILLHAPGYAESKFNIFAVLILSQITIHTGQRWAPAEEEAILISEEPNERWSFRSTKSRPTLVPSCMVDMCLLLRVTVVCISSCLIESSDAWWNFPFLCQCDITISWCSTGRKPHTQLYTLALSLAVLSSLFVH